MDLLNTIRQLFITLFHAVYHILWGDLIAIPLPGGGSLGLSLLVLILIPSGIYFTLRTKALPFRLFPEMLRVTLEKKKLSQKDAISGVQALIVSTATRVGMGNLVGVVAAISAGGAGAVFWIYTPIVLVAISAVIVLRKDATVKVLDIMVPVMAACYFLLTIFIIVRNIGLLPAVFQKIFLEAFGLRQAVAGGFGAVIMNGAKRGLFSNEAGSGSAPCAAAAADIDHPAKEGLLQAFGVFIDTIVICSCSAMIMLLTPADLTRGLEGMDLLQTSMEHHMGQIGVVFIAGILWLFSFSTFIGILFYARPNVAYLFGDNWLSQTLYKVLALVMLFIGGLAAYTFVWDLGDIGVGLMTVFNMIALIPLAPKALGALEDYERWKRMKADLER